MPLTGTPGTVALLTTPDAQDTGRALTPEKYPDFSRNHPVPRHRRQPRSPAGLADFQAPALIVWAAQDRVMPPEHGRRLAQLLPDSRLVEVDDSYTLIPLDQPARLAQAIPDFTASPSRTNSPSSTDPAVSR